MKSNILCNVSLALVLLLLLAISSHGQPITAAVPSASTANTLVEASVHIDVATAASQASDDSATPFKISLLPTPEQTAESVKLESEALQSRVLSAYDNSQQQVADLTDPLPILDTIAEHEKYGNQGDMFDGISRTIVNGYEAFSNLLNHIIQRPKEVARSISRGITAQLDIIGGKLVGL